MATQTKPVSITVDKNKCRFSLFDPTGCKKCLEVCPPVVFGCVPAEERKYGSAPTVYKLTIVWEELCNGCGVCVRICPQKAISIKMNGKPVS